MLSLLSLVNNILVLFLIITQAAETFVDIKSTVRRRRFEKEETIHEDDEDEEKPSYMNIGFHKKNVPKTATTTSNNNNNHNDKATPSYINLEFHKKENANAKRRRKRP